MQLFENSNLFVHRPLSAEHHGDIRRVQRRLLNERPELMRVRQFHLSLFFQAASADRISPDDAQKVVDPLPSTADETLTFRVHDIIAGQKGGRFRYWLKLEPNDTYAAEQRVFARRVRAINSHWMTRPGSPHINLCSTTHEMPATTQKYLEENLPNEVAFRPIEVASRFPLELVRPSDEGFQADPQELGPMPAHRPNALPANFLRILHMGMQRTVDVPQAALGD